MKKKIDSSFRILIPIELRSKFNLHKGDEIEIYEEDNKIILTKSENVLDLNLEDQKVEVHNKTYKELSDKEKSYLQQQLENTSITYKNNNEKEILQYNEISMIEHKEEPLNYHPTLNNSTSNYSDIKCSICKNYVEKHRLNMIKVNDNPICQSCSDNLKEELKQEVLYNKRVKDIQSKLDY